ncbi:hypothetical protein SEEN4900_09221, partial [Salmonella enterica subsp. enterica serovar Newport str. WA_14900]
YFSASRQGPVFTVLNVIQTIPSKNERRRRIEDAHLLFPGRGNVARLAGEEPG